MSRSTPSKCSRNAEIRQRHSKGEAVRDSAQEFEIAEQRVSQIIHGQRQ
jgi:Mor family transcriptional regulator